MRSIISACVLVAAVTSTVDAAVRITEFMSEGQGDTLSGNGGRRQREFFEITNLGSSAVDVSTWSYNDNNTNDPHNWGPAIGSIAAGESIVFTQMTDADFHSVWNLPASVRVYSYLQLSNLGNGDTINIYNSFTQDASTLMDSLTYLSDARGSGISRNRPFDGGDGQYENNSWIVSEVGDSFGSVLAPNPPTFAGYESYSYTDLANPGRYIPEPATLSLIGLVLLLRRTRG